MRQWLHSCGHYSWQRVKPPRKKIGPCHSKHFLAAREGRACGTSCEPGKSCRTCGRDEIVERQVSTGVMSARRRASTLYLDESNSCNLYLPYMHACPSPASCSYLSRCLRLHSCLLSLFLSLTSASALAGQGTQASRQAFLGNGRVTCTHPRSWT